MSQENPPEMYYRMLGTTGLQVSVLSFGFWATYGVKDGLTEDDGVDGAELVGQGGHRHLRSGPRDDRADPVHDPREDHSRSVLQITDPPRIGGAELGDRGCIVIQRMT